MTWAAIATATFLILLAFARDHYRSEGHPDVLRAVGAAAVITAALAALFALALIGH